MPALATEAKAPPPKLKLNTGNSQAIMQSPKKIKVPAKGIVGSSNARSGINVKPAPGGGKGSRPGILTDDGGEHEVSVTK